MLNPATHTADPLDHRTSWLLGRVLGALGYAHMAPERREQVSMTKFGPSQDIFIRFDITAEFHVSRQFFPQLHTSFAAELESVGLWHWSVFPLLHLADPAERRSKVRIYLNEYLIQFD